MAEDLSRQNSLHDTSYDAEHDVSTAVQLTGPQATDPKTEAEDQELAKVLEESRNYWSFEFGKKDEQFRELQSIRTKDQEVHMMPSMSNVFASLSTRDAETLIYIGPPPKAPGQSGADYEYIVQCFSNLHRVNSQVLRDLGSSAFEKLLGPKSERTRRRFGKEGLLKGVNTERIKYYIDLRPAEEGDEAVELITDLTCSQGILNWHRAAKKYSISPTLVCGRDDFRSELDEFRDETKKEADSSQKESGPKREAEYSALRHRSAVERVLQAICHNDPKLDSAPKMWNYFQVAKHLDVAKHERISGWITKWLYTHPNFNFIQSNPEVVYRIGLGILSTNMLCDAYSMLAGEKALLDTSDPSLRLHLKGSIHGRPLEILDDDERNRVDHAAASLHARMKARFEYLTKQNMDWLKQSEEYTKLHELSPRNDTEREALANADKHIKDYVGGRILWVLARNYLSDHAEFDHAMTSCREFREDLPAYFNEVYSTLSEEQRLLTRTFWISLQNERFEAGDVNMWTASTGANGVLHLLPQSAWHLSTDNCSIGTEMCAREKRQPGTGLKKMYLVELAKSIEEVNKIYARHFSEDSEGSHNLAEKNFNRHLKPSWSREPSSTMLDPQTENSTGHGKHELLNPDSDEDTSLEMSNITRARSGSEKRQRISIQAVPLLAAPDHQPSTTLPLRTRSTDLMQEGSAVSQVEYDAQMAVQSEHLSFWERAKRGDYGLPKKRVARGTDKAPSSAQNAEELSSSSNTNSSKSVSFSDFRTPASDTDARIMAEETGAISWRSVEGDVYIRAQAIHRQRRDKIVWFATPEPFKWSQRLKTQGGHQYKTDFAKEYWRAATHQLFCKLPDNSVRFVREDLISTPTLAKVSSHITYDKKLKHYTAAYDAYARHLAEILFLPYWTALNGDMYLRNPPPDLPTGADVWNHASLVFNSPHKDLRVEDGLRVEYWCAPAGHLFRRRGGRIELFTHGEEEPVPHYAASILAAPLKFVTSDDVQTNKAIWPQDTKSMTAEARGRTSQDFDARCSPGPQKPMQKHTPVGNYKYSKPSPLQAVTPEQSWYPYTKILLPKMLLQFSDIVSRYCVDILHPPHMYHTGDAIPRNLMDTLMCLTEDEWKYLPLWAGGNDDGTGGVFDDADVPNLEAGGFEGGKRGLGSERVDGKGEDGWSDVGSEAVSTLGRVSKLATDGIGTVKSFDTASTSSFMKTDELWEQIRDMKEIERPGQRQAEDEDEDVDQATVAAASDVQGTYFGDVDDDDKDVEIMVEDDHDSFDFVDDDGDDDDGFVPVAKD